MRRSHYLGSVLLAMVLVLGGARPAVGQPRSQWRIRVGRRWWCMLCGKVS